MKFVAAVATFVAMLGCSRPRPRYPHAANFDAVIATHVADGAGKHVAPPSTLEPRPWKVGQWSIVLYRPKGGSNEQATYRATRVIAEDSCGVWIQIVRATYDRRSRWTMCLRPSVERARNTRDVLDRLQVVVGQEDEQRPRVIDFRKGGRREERKRDYEGIASTLVVPSFVDWPELARETVDVPAGRVVDALRRTSVPGPGPSLILWAHSDVPFDAMVKSSSSDGYEFVLLGFGDTDPGDSTVLAHVAESSRAERLIPFGMNYFFGFAAGLNQFTGTANQDSDGATSFSWRVGNPITRTFDLVTSVGAIIGARNRSAPTQTQDTLLATAGVRWIPFRTDQYSPRSGPLASRLSIDASLGYAELLEDEETIARGLAVALAVDFVTLRGLGWEVALELSDQLQLYNSGQGLRHSLAFSLVAQLYLWR